METLNLSYVYTERDGNDECMRAGSLSNMYDTYMYLQPYS